VIWEAEGQRHEVGVYDEEVGEIFLYGADDFMVVCFCKPFEGGFLDDVAEIWPQSATTSYYRS
jgi:hypothetical protein